MLLAQGSFIDDIPDLKKTKNCLEKQIHFLFFVFKNRNFYIKCRNSYTKNIGLSYVLKITCKILKFEVVKIL